MNEVSLFSGYCGFTLGLKLAGIQTRTVLYCENEPYCQEIIRARVREGILDDAPIWPDVRTLDGSCFAGKVGIITAGFPCQPHSVAGQRRGEADERNLWPDTLRLIREVGARFVLLENVPGVLANGYGGTVIGQLSEIGYDCIWDCVSASAVGASHHRSRWWLLAYPYGEGLERIYQASGRKHLQSTPRNLPRYEWNPTPRVCRKSDGIAHRMDRIRACGNGIVPAVVKQFLRIISNDL